MVAIVVEVETTVAVNNVVVVGDVDIVQVVEVISRTNIPTSNGSVKMIKLRKTKMSLIFVTIAELKVTVSCV